MLRSQQWWQVTLASVGDAVMATDIDLPDRLPQSSGRGAHGLALGRSPGPAHRRRLRHPRRTDPPAGGKPGAARSRGRAHPGSRQPHDPDRPRRERARYRRQRRPDPRRRTASILGVVLVFRDVTEKRKADRLRAARLAVAQILSEGGSVQQSGAAPGRSAAASARVGWRERLDGRLRGGALACRAAWASPESGLHGDDRGAPIRPDRARRGLRRSRLGTRRNASGWATAREIEACGRAEPEPPAAATRRTGPLPAPSPAPTWRARRTAHDRRRERRRPRAVASTPASIPIGSWRRPSPPSPPRSETSSSAAGCRSRFAATKPSSTTSSAARWWACTGWDPTASSCAPTAPSSSCSATRSRSTSATTSPSSTSTRSRSPRSSIGCGAARTCAIEEVRLRAKDGSIRHVVIDSNGRWEDGRFVHSRCFTRDVTDRKNAETNLRFLHQSSQTLAELVDYRTTLERIAQLAVPDFADWCTVQIARPDRHRAGGLGPPRPRSRAVGARSVRASPGRSRRRVRHPAGAAHRQAELVRVITDEMLVSSGAHRESLAAAARAPALVVDDRAAHRQEGRAAAPSASSPRNRDAAIPRPTSRPPRISPSRRRSPSTTRCLYEEAREADRRKDEFLATLAHELRNPLAPIRSGIDLLALDPATRARRRVELMRRQIEHLVRLADDLLDISRITHGKVELRRESVELFGIVDRCGGDGSGGGRRERPRPRRGLAGRSRSGSTPTRCACCR